MSQDKPEQHETAYSKWAEEAMNNPQPPEPDNDDPNKPTKAETLYSDAAKDNAAVVDNPAKDVTENRPPENTVP